MSDRHVTGFKVFDPAKTGVSGATDPYQGAGGGHITGNGTYYSYVSSPTRPGHTSFQIDLTGTLAGTLTLEASDGTEDEKFTGTYFTEARLSGGGFAAGVATLVAGAIVGGSNPQPAACPDYEFSNLRWKLVVTSGTGDITIRGSIKA
jgi:hypothetical protein